MNWYLISDVQLAGQPVMMFTSLAVATHVWSSLRNASGGSRLYQWGSGTWQPVHP